MVEALGKTFPVFTIGFEESDYSEVTFAKVAAERWGLEHHVEILTPDALAILPLLVRHYGEPFADSSAIPTFFVSRLARQSVPMVLSGDGGDEFFLGYENYSRWLWWLSFDGAHPVKNWVRPMARIIRPQRYPRREPSLANWLDFVSLMPTALRQSLWREPFRSVALLEVEAFAAAAKQVTACRPATMAALADRLTYLPDDILNKVDVASMAHGLEVRTPLVDLRVAEFAASLPEQVNMKRTGGRRWEGKLLLKRLLRRYLPEDHIRRPKQGFSIPIDDWFRSGTPLRNALEERIHDRQSMLNQILDSDTVQGVVEGRHGYRKWQLLVLDEWARQCPQLALPSAAGEQTHEADGTR
jgi:asparagine synthase (glutamine-hydrolysing)